MTLTVSTIWATDLGKIVDYDLVMPLFSNVWSRKKKFCLRQILSTSLSEAKSATNLQSLPRPKHPDNKTAYLLNQGKSPDVIQPKMIYTIFFYLYQHFLNLPQLSQFLNTLFALLKS